MRDCSPTDPFAEAVFEVGLLTSLVGTSARALFCGRPSCCEAIFSSSTSLSSLSKHFSLPPRICTSFSNLVSRSVCVRISLSSLSMAISTLNVVLIFKASWRSCVRWEKLVQTLRNSLAQWEDLNNFTRNVVLYMKHP